jgi:enoyl-CoA hydratase/carnithine racemase
MGSPKEAKPIHRRRRSRFYWRVTFDHPPLKIFGPENIPQLNEIVTALESDDRVKVVVFDSAMEGLLHHALRPPREARGFDQHPVRPHGIAGAA